MAAIAQIDENIMSVSQSLPSSPCTLWTDVEANCESVERKSSSWDCLSDMTEKTGWLSDSWKFETIKNASIFKNHDPDEREKNILIFQNEKVDVRTKQKYKSKLPVYGKRMIVVEHHSEMLQENTEKKIENNEKRSWKNIDTQRKEKTQIQVKHNCDYPNNSKPDISKEKICKDMNQMHIKHEQNEKYFKNKDSRIPTVKFINLRKKECEELSKEGAVNDEPLSQHGKYSTVAVHDTLREEEYLKVSDRNIDKSNQQYMETSKIPKFSNKVNIKSSLLTSGNSVTPLRKPKLSVPPSVTIKNTLRLSNKFEGHGKSPMCSRIPAPGGVKKSSIGPASEGSIHTESSLQQGQKTQMSTSSPQSIKVDPKGISRLGDLLRPTSIQQTSEQNVQ
ncbi:unnamed protein product, partial [Meganyctiphanes norvegica]